MTSSDRTADRLAILELIARYSYAWDECDTEAYVALFTDDAVFEADPEAPDGPVISCHGRDAIRAWAQPVHERRDRSRMQIRHNQTGTLFEELTDARADPYDAAHHPLRPRFGAVHIRRLLRRISEDFGRVAVLPAHAAPRLSDVSATPGEAAPSEAAPSEAGTTQPRSKGRQTR